ncbi:hypothetical protein STRCI_003129 [Streptomyces cinnabarinus]|uniref:DUF2975 domain-containing protein n=1 Tax=Streptomyces cinnabarinus TaxID=67287 RepID=A0ABY7KC60_9ACTN|nr:hypothetical protein [Streptomyces cinnabarinus]WAZ21924.1 hypothetical protein STRCI_003129 [Streptomyces cinnabarinus]
MEFEELRDLLLSRVTWIAFGVGTQLLCALAAFWYAWGHGATRDTWLVALAACAVCQGIAVTAVLWPGAEAGSRENTEGHQGLTIGVLCLIWIVAALPGGGLLMLTGHSPDGHEVQAVFLGGTAFTLTSIAGLITAVALADQVRPSGDANDAPGASGLGDFDDGGAGD